MTASKSPPPDGQPRKRGRPTEHLAMAPEHAGDALDRMLGKKAAAQPRDPQAAVVRSKRTKKK